MKHQQAAESDDPFGPRPIFVDSIPIIGEVPMVFFIPETGEAGDTDEKSRLRALIEKNGGLLSEFHECFTY